MTTYTSSFILVLILYVLPNLINIIHKGGSSLHSFAVIVCTATLILMLEKAGFTFLARLIVVPPIFLGYCAGPMFTIFTREMCTPR